MPCYDAAEAGACASHAFLLPARGRSGTAALLVRSDIRTCFVSERAAPSVCGQDEAPGLLVTEVVAGRRTAGDLSRFHSLRPRSPQSTNCGQASRTSLPGCVRRSCIFSATHRHNHLRRSDDSALVT